MHFRYASDSVIKVSVRNMTAGIKEFSVSTLEQHNMQKFFVSFVVSSSPPCYYYIAIISQSNYRYYLLYLLR